MELKQDLRIIFEINLLLYYHYLLIKIAYKFMCYIDKLPIMVKINH